jgi:hypothetical protein
VSENDSNRPKSTMLSSPVWLDIYSNTLGNYELEPESEEEENRFEEQLRSLEADKKAGKTSPLDPKNKITIAKIELALQQIETDKETRDNLKDLKKINQNILKMNPAMPEAQKKNIEMQIAKIDFELQQVSAKSAVKKELYTKMRVNKLFSGKNEAGRKVLYEGASSNTFKARHAFIAHLKSHQELLPQSQAESPKGMISMEKLLTPEGVKLYELACKEERDSIAFRDAVFISSTKTYGGKKWGNRLIGWLGGPSSIGKSYASDEAMKREVIPTKPGEKQAENHVVCIDGGVERNMSQMRQLVVQLADVRGHSISNLEDHSEGLKTKKIVKAATLETNLNMLVVTTFSSEHLPKIQKEMKGYEQATITQKFYQVRGPSDELELLPLGLDPMIKNKIYLQKGQKDGKPSLLYSFLNNENKVISGSIEMDVTDLSKEALRQNKFNIVDKIKEKERSLSVNSGYGRLKRTVNIMGDKRAFRSEAPDFIPDDPNDLVRANNRNIGFEGKAYDPGPFDFGVHESNRAREWFIKNILKNQSQEGINERYIEITNDLVYIKKDNSGGWVEAGYEDKFDDPALIRTNLRIYSALSQYTPVASDLYPSDFETTVWIKNEDWVNYNPNLNFKPTDEEKKDYVEVSLAAFKVAKAKSNLKIRGYEPNTNFGIVWESLLKDNFEVSQFKKAIIDGGGNPGRSLENRADLGETTGFVSAAIKAKVGGNKSAAQQAKVPSSPAPLLKQERSSNLSASGFLSRSIQSASSPVLEVAEPNLTLETLKARAQEEGSTLDINILFETQAPDASHITSLKFQSNVLNEASHVKYEAKLKKNTNTVVYKMEPGNVGANALNETEEMKKMYALLVNVAFEAHFSNPATQNKQFIITVLPNLGKIREKAFIQAIKEKAEKEGLNPSQIKLLVPGMMGTREEPILGLTKKNQVMQNR